MVEEIRYPSTIKVEYSKCCDYPIFEYNHKTTGKTKYCCQCLEDIKEE